MLVALKIAIIEIIMANADQSLHLKTMALMFAVRFMLAITDINYDYPDEYWQGPEISHKMARGYGFETWEWTIADPIRTPVYQGYLSIGYLTCINLSCPLSVM